MRIERFSSLLSICFFFNCGSANAEEIPRIAIAIFATSSTAHSPEVNFIVRNEEPQSLDLLISAEPTFGFVGCPMPADTWKTKYPGVYTWMYAGERQNAQLVLHMKPGAIYNFYVSLAMHAVSDSSRCGIKYRFRAGNGVVLRNGFFRPGMDKEVVDAAFAQPMKSDHSVADHTFEKSISIAWWQNESADVPPTALSLRGCEKALALVVSRDPPIPASAVPASMTLGRIGSASLLKLGPAIPKDCALVLAKETDLQRGARTRVIPVVPQVVVTDYKYQPLVH